jgi:hypothetical protein
MSERASKLADQLDAVVTDALSTVEAIPDDKWTAFCEPEQCTVAALATHFGSATAGVMSLLVQPVAEGKPVPPITPEQVDAGNAQNARENANSPKAEVLTIIRTNCGAAVAAVRGYSDEQLDRTAVLFFSPDPVSTEFVIENALVNHLRGHLDSLKSAVA